MPAVPGVLRMWTPAGLPGDTDSVTLNDPSLEKQLELHISVFLKFLGQLNHLSLMWHGVKTNGHYMARSLNLQENRLLSRIQKSRKKYMETKLKKRWHRKRTVDKQAENFRWQSTQVIKTRALLIVADIYSKWRSGGILCLKSHLLLFHITGLCREDN